MRLCCYILTPNTFVEGVFTPATMCVRPVPYTMVRDDDGNLVRKYQLFCDEHQKLVDAMPDEDES